MTSLSSLKYICNMWRFLFNHQVYRQRLAEFRNILPRQQSRAFQEATEANLIRGQLTEINARFDKLKLRYGKHLRLLNELVAKHQLYTDSVGGVSTWLGGAEATLGKMKSEPIGATKETILRQIGKAEVCVQPLSLITLWILSSWKLGMGSMQNMC